MKVLVWLVAVAVVALAMHVLGVGVRWSVRRVDRRKKPGPEPLRDSKGRMLFRFTADCTFSADGIDDALAQLGDHFDAVYRTVVNEYEGDDDVNVALRRPDDENMRLHFSGYLDLAPVLKGIDTSKGELQL